MCRRKEKSFCYCGKFWETLFAVIHTFHRLQKTSHSNWKAVLPQLHIWTDCSMFSYKSVKKKKNIILNVLKCSADSLPISLSLTFYYSVIFLDLLHSAFLQPHQRTLCPKQNRYQQALVNKDKPNGDAKDREVVYATLLLSSLRLSSEITGGGAWRHCIHLLSDMSISSDDSTRQQAWHLAALCVFSKYLQCSSHRAVLG